MTAQHPPLTIARVTVKDPLPGMIAGDRVAQQGKRCWAVKQPPYGPNPAHSLWSVYDPDGGATIGCGEGALEDIKPLCVWHEWSPEPRWVASLPAVEVGIGWN